MTSETVHAAKIRPVFVVTVRAHGLDERRAPEEMASQIDPESTIAMSNPLVRAG